jgi:hypothetical protein
VDLGCKTSEVSAADYLCSTVCSSKSFALVVGYFAGIQRYLR